jgi:hypothetical protein
MTRRKEWISKVVDAGLKLQQEGNNRRGMYKKEGLNCQKQVS